jgi:hypothetical protein
VPGERAEGIYRQRPQTTSATNTGESRAIEKFLDNAAMLLHEQASTRLVEYDCSNVNIAGRAGQAMLPT